MYFCRVSQTDFHKLLPNGFPQKNLNIFLQNFLNRFPQNFQNGFLQNFANRFPQTFAKWISTKKFKQISAKFSKWISAKNFNWIFNILKWARRALFLGSKGPTVAAEGCSRPQELEKAARRAAIFLV